MVRLRQPIVDPLPAEDPERTQEIARRLVLTLERATAAARQLFGDAFVIVPLFVPSARPAWRAGARRLASSRTRLRSRSGCTPSRACARPWRTSLTMALGAWMNAPLADPLVVQLPGLAGTPWIRGTFGKPLPEGGWLAIVALRGASPLSGLQCGLVPDVWTEDVPAGQATTGVAFEFNRPNASHPQALLVPFPPGRGRNWPRQALKAPSARPCAGAAARDRARHTHGRWILPGLPAVLSEFTVSRLASMNLTQRSAVAIDHITG